MTLWLSLVHAGSFAPATDAFPLEYRVWRSATVRSDELALGVLLADGRRGLLAVDLSSGAASEVGPSVGENWYLPLSANLATGPRYLCKVGDTVFDIVDCETQEIVVGEDLVLRLEDADGDGYDDILGYDALYLFDGTDWVEAPYPPLFNGGPNPVGDIDADGRADLWTMEITDTVWMGYFYDFRAMRMRVHRATGQGYDADPYWSIDLDGIVVDALAVQGDADPQMEVLVAYTDHIDSLGSPITSARLGLIDLVDGQPQWTELDGTTLYQPIPWPPADRPSVLRPIGDIDGDGTDEALAIGGPLLKKGPGEDNAWLRIVGASTGWSTSEPLLGFEVGLTYGDFTADTYTLTHDVDGDGRLDIIALWENDEPDEDTPITSVQVWYAPWLEADPVLPHTGDTGTTGDTSLPSTSATGDTGRGATADLPGHASAKEGSCGCQAAPTTTLWSLLARRRRGATPTASGSACPPTAAWVQRATRALLVDYPVCHRLPTRSSVWKRST